MSVEIRRGVAPTVGRLLICMITLACGVGFVFTEDIPLWLRILAPAFGSAVTFSALRDLIMRRPRVRATESGVWFGGGRIVPWHDINSIFVAGISIRVNYAVRGRTESIAFELERRALWRLPITSWFFRPFAIGDIDITPHDSGDKTSVLVAKLEAMRTLAPSELPPARSLT